MFVNASDLYIGQKVILKPYKDCNEFLNYCIVSYMIPHFGKTVTIAGIGGEDGYLEAFSIEEDGYECLWETDWIAEAIIDPNYKPPILNELF